MKAKRPSITEVAKLAKVSIGTVSNVLNGLSSVDPKIRDRVEKAVSQIGYVRNLGAASMRSKSNAVYGLIIHDIRNPAYAQIAHGAKLEAAKYGYKLLVLSSGKSLTLELENLKLFEELRLSGIVLAAISNENLDYAKGIFDRGTPMVILTTQDSCGIPHVSVNNKMGGKLAAQRLVALKRKNILFVAGSLQIRALNERFNGIESVLKKDNSIRLSHFETEDQTLEAGIHAAKVIEKLPLQSRPTGILAGNDLIAIGIQQTLMHNKIINPGKDLSIIGFDDIDIAQLDTVALTTIRQNFKLQGEQTVQILQKLQDTTKTYDSEKLSVLSDPELIIRKS